MSYPTPAPALQNLTQGTNSPKLLSFFGENGVELEIEHLKGHGWLIEVRYDRAFPGFRRQPWTGQQQEIERSELKCREAGDTFEITSGLDRCILEKESARFLLSCADRDYFVSAKIPFSLHAEAVSIQEDIPAPKISEWNFPTPFRKVPAQYETHMVRFQYDRPASVTLGLAGQTGELNRQGYRFHLCNNDEYKHLPSRLAMYQSWPLLFHAASTGTGWVSVFNDNPSRTYADLGDFFPQYFTFESLTNNARVFIAFDESLSAVSTTISKLLGKMTLPPSWAFGYQQCRFSYTSTAEIRSIVHTLKEQNFPLDVIYFDGDYMDKYRMFTRDPASFGDLDVCLNELKKQNVRSICIVDPSVKIEPGYELYEKIERSGQYLKNLDGTPLGARQWAGESLLPDFHTEEVQEIWSDAQCKFLQTYPFDGVWNDMNEPSNFNGMWEKNAQGFTERGSHKSEFNLYGMGMIKASALGWKKYKPDKRTLLITRSGYPGAQQHAVAWHGDNSAWWEHLRLAIDLALEFSLSGQFITGPDVPGFFGNPSDDLAVRFFQLGAFMPYFRGHSYTLAKNKEPFAYQEPARSQIRNALNLRYSLLREWYSGMEACIRQSRSPLLPVFHEQHQIVRDCFLLFDKLLVCPIVERDQSMKSVYLPPGQWYRLGETTRPIDGGQWILESVNLDSVPAYVRAGTILTRNTPGLNTPETFAQSEHFEVYPYKGKAVGYWYADDGESLNDPQAQRMELKLQNGEVVRTSLPDRRQR